MGKATPLLRKASELVRNKEYADAVEVYLQATETEPSDCRAWFGLGVCLYKIGNLDVARIALERADKMGYPKAGEALSRLRKAEKRRQAEGGGAKATSKKARKSRTSSATEGKTPPRPLQRPEEEQLDLDRYLRVMLVENLESHRKKIQTALEGTIRHIEVVPADYGVSTSDTMSGTVHYDAAILDWDTDPDAAAGLIQILNIKRPSLFVVCMTDAWDPETSAQIFEAGADYHLVKQDNFAATVPLVLAQWARRDRAVALEQRGREGEGQPEQWPPALDAVGEMMIYVAPDYAVARANQAAMKAFKRRKDQFVGRVYSEPLYGSEEPPESCPFAEALASGEPCADEVQPPGLDKTLVARVWPELDETGAVSGALGILREKEPAAEAPEELREREALYRNLAEYSNVGLAMIGTDGEALYANHALCTMADRTSEEIVEQPIGQLVPAEDQQSLRECIEAAIDIGESGGRISLQRPGGDRFPVEARLACFDDGGDQYVVAALFDVTELEEAEKSLWDETRKWTELVEQSFGRLQCGVVVLDEEGAVTWSNPVAAELFDCPAEQLEGADYLEALRSTAGEPGEDPAGDGLQVVERAHQNGRPLQRQGVVLDGRRFDYWSSPADSTSRNIARVEHFYPAQEAPQTPPAGEDELTELAAAVPEMIFTTDRNGNITWCNPASGETAGYSPGQLRGKSLRSLVPDEQQQDLERLLAEALDQGRRVERREVQMRRGDGQRFWAELTLLPGNNGHGGLHGAVRDVTEHKMTDAIRAILSGEQSF